MTKVDTPKRSANTKKRYVRLKPTPPKDSVQAKGTASPSATNRREILTQKIEALIDLAKQSPAYTGGLATSSTNATLSLVTPLTPDDSSALPSEDELERSIDYLLSLIKSRTGLAKR